jgi:hypothetical protein
MVEQDFEASMKDAEGEVNAIAGQGGGADQGGNSKSA